MQPKMKVLSFATFHISNHIKYIVEKIYIVESKYESNGNYDGNDRFSIPQKTKEERTLYSSLLQ
jgi:hypothetical protein